MLLLYKLRTVNSMKCKRKTGIINRKLIRYSRRRKTINQALVRRNIIIIANSPILFISVLLLFTFAGNYL
jgi:hypothetical protein